MEFKFGKARIAFGDFLQQALHLLFQDRNLRRGSISIVQQKVGCTELRLSFDQGHALAHQSLIALDKRLAQFGKAFIAREQFNARTTKSDTLLRAQVTLALQCFFKTVLGQGKFGPQQIALGQNFIHRQRHLHFKPAR